MPAPSTITGLKGRLAHAVHESGPTSKRTVHGPRTLEGGQGMAAALLEEGRLVYTSLPTITEAKRLLERSDC